MRSWRPAHAANFVSRTVSKSYRVASDHVFALGPALSTPTITKLTPVQPIRYGAQLASQAEYGGAATISVAQVARNTFSVQVSSAYLGAVPAIWDLTIPDLTGVDGWNPAWELVPGISTAVSVTAASATAPVWAVIRRAWPDGASVRTAVRRQISLIP